MSQPASEAPPKSGMRSSEKPTMADFAASIVVFLVALPLCMGIAIASGVPPALGLITGIVGGIVVGTFAGQPFQVSGPAASLAVMVLQFVKEFGIPALGLVVIVMGALQLLAGIAGLGRWFRAVSPALVQGMLSGIGALIFAGQFHVMVDDKPRDTGIANWIAIPEAIGKAVDIGGTRPHHLAASIGVVTIIAIVVWNKFRPNKLKSIPGPLIGVAIATAFATLLKLPIDHVLVPRNLIASFNIPTRETLSVLKIPGFWMSAVGMAIIASAATLLTATAIDRMHKGTRTDYDKELRSQGIGNMLCGVVGALPMTGVIVRGSANVEAGAKSRWSTIMHGAWMLVLVALLPQVLSLIPTASLAAVLVYTGWRLLGLDAARALFKKGRFEGAIWAVTVVMVVATNLLIGVGIGLGLSLIRLLATFARLEVDVTHEGERYEVVPRGAATFLSLPKFADIIETIPDGSDVHVHLDRVAYMDHAFIEILEDWQERHNGHVTLETELLQQAEQHQFLMANQEIAPSVALLKELELKKNPAA